MHRRRSRLCALLRQLRCPLLLRRGRSPCRRLQGRSRRRSRRRRGRPLLRWAARHPNGHAQANRRRRQRRPRCRRSADSFRTRSQHRGGGIGFGQAGLQRSEAIRRWAHGIVRSRHRWECGGRRRRGRGGPAERLSGEGGGIGQAAAPQESSHGLLRSAALGVLSGRGCLGLHRLVPGGAPLRSPRLRRCRRGGRPCAWQGSSGGGGGGGGGGGVGCSGICCDLGQRRVQPMLRVAQALAQRSFRGAQLLRQLALRLLDLRACAGTSGRRQQQQQIPPLRSRKLFGSSSGASGRLQQHQCGACLPRQLGESGL